MQWARGSPRSRASDAMQRNSCAATPWTGEHQVYQRRGHHRCPWPAPKASGRLPAIGDTEGAVAVEVRTSVLTPLAAEVFAAGAAGPTWIRESSGAARRVHARPGGY